MMIKTTLALFIVAAAISGTTVRETIEFLPTETKTKKSKFEINETRKVNI